MSLPSKPCKFCGSLSHYSYTCFKNPKVANSRPLKRTPLARSIKPIRQKGRVGKATDKAVEVWSREQKPNHQGYYECHYCHTWITYLRAEHSESKARRPDLRTDTTKFLITCDPCNDMKRSKSHDEFCTRCVI